MPLRSGGCYKCRSRKIRCDETRPRCRRCDTHGVLCPGYKHERSGDIEIRDQTKLTVQRVRVVSATKDRLHPRRNDKKTKSTEQPPNQEPKIPCPPLFDGVTSRCLGHHVQKIPQLAEILSPAVYRSELYNTFIQLYVPQGNIPRDASLEFYQLDFIKTVASLSSASPAVIHALDAVSLVQVGSIHNDQQLLHEGVRSYMRSLKNLSASLSRSDCAKDDCNLVAASVLTLCELYDEIKQRGHGWISHLQGTQKLLEARGPDSIDSHLSRFVYWNTVHSSIANGLIQRKSAKLPTDEWRALESELLPFCEYGESCNIGRTLTSLLERHDELNLDQPNILQDLDTLILDCKRLEDDMAAFYPQNANWPLKPVTCFSCFQNSASSFIISHAYDFPSYMPAFLQSQYWLRMYFLRANMQSLYALRSELFDKHTEEIIEDSEILELVLNLCRCMPFFAEPCNATIGHISCFLPLHVAAYFFHEKRLWPWLRWVRFAREIISDRGLSMPKLGLPEMPPEAEEEILYQELAGNDMQAPCQVINSTADQSCGAG